MNILAINGSPHGAKGTTGMMLDETVKAAQAAGAGVTTLVVSEHKLAPCRGCDACHKTGTCSIKDDFGQFKEALLAADGIILASPNYINSVSAQLKCLMDRSCGLLHCLALRGKHAAAIVTSGGGGEEPVAQYMLGFLRIMGSWTVGSAGADAGTLFDPAKRPAALAAAAKLGQDLVAAIAAGMTYPEQQAQQQAFAERMKQLVTHRAGEWPYEAQYWRAHGGCDLSDRDNDHDTPCFPQGASTTTTADRS